VAQSGKEREIIYIHIYVYNEHLFRNRKLVWNEHAHLATGTHSTLINANHQVTGDRLVIYSSIYIYIHILIYYKKKKYICIFIYVYLFMCMNN
jgi:hypothetical protein